MPVFIAKLWKHRYYSYALLKNELKGRYTRSYLGILWLIIQPLIQVAVYAFIFSTVFLARLPGMSQTPGAYAIYLLAGIAAWTLLSEIITRNTTVFTRHANLIKKYPVPKISLFIAAIGEALFNNLILLILVIILSLILNPLFQLSTLIYLLPVFFLIVLLASSLGVLLATLNVFIRDIEQAVSVVLQLLFWLTPIVYTLNVLPEKYQILIHLNPASAFAGAYQNIFVYNHAPDWITLLYPLLLSLFIIMIANIIYNKAKHELVDVL